MDPSRAAALTLALLGCAGCRGVFGIEDPVALSDGGGAAVADGAPLDAMWCFTDGLDLCVTVVPAPAAPPPARIDSEEDCHAVVAPTSAGDPEMCVQVYESVSWDANLTGVPIRLTGKRPIVIAATGPIVLSAVLDASSGQEGADPRGAGSGETACPFDGPPGAGGESGGGGAGGAHGTAGGNGGTAALNMTTMPGLSGPLPPADIGAVHGGCDGQTGEAPDAAIGGAGGAGGGAVWLLSRTSVMITSGGGVRAGGGGGRGSVSAYGGGGGGGAGGLIGLGAPMISVAGTLTATGAGGGGGAGASPAAPGADGEHGQTDGSSALGGAGGGATGGPGGPGGTGESGMVGERSVDGAGGGGGGTGRIFLAGAQRTLVLSRISPTPLQVP